MGWINQLIQCTQQHLGKTRTAWENAIQEFLVLPPTEKQVALGLLKMVEDAVVFDQSQSMDSESIRKEVFLAAVQWRQDHPGHPLARDEVLNKIGELHNSTGSAIEKNIYTDLKEAHFLSFVPSFSPGYWIDLYEESQIQAIFLRAIRIQAEIFCDHAEGYRALFRKMKFLRILTSIQAMGNGRYRLVIDGPLSLFESTTKYGLQLALLFPVLKRCTAAKLQTDLTWGKNETPLRFDFEWQLENKQMTTHDEVSMLPEDLALLVKKIEALQPEWLVCGATDLLTTPNHERCVPDLQFIHKVTGEVIYLEMLGYWSRDAVWKRLDWVNQGLPYKILFAAGKHLRVSEHALDDQSNGMLYVYNRTPSAPEILRRLDTLKNRTVVNTPQHRENQEKQPMLKWVP